MYERERIIRDIPFIAWFFGLFTIGISLYGFVGRFLPLWVQLLLIAIGLVTLLLPSILNVYADRGRRVLEIEQVRLFGAKRTEVQYDQISRIYVERSASQDSDGSRSYTYRVILILENGDQVPLRGYSSSARRKHERQAEAIRQAIGLDSVDRTPESLGEAFAEAMHLIPAENQESLTGVPAGIQETDGIHWQLESFQIGGPTQGSMVYRWSTTDVDVPNDFVFIVQRMEGMGEQKGLMKLAGKFLFKTSIQMYGFDQTYTPGIERANTVEDVDKRLVEDFFVFTNDPGLPRQLLNPWIVMPLLGWARRYELNLGEKEFHQLSVLFSPLGLFVSQMGRLDQAEIDELVSLGIELARAK
ncbi:MAG: hypothetical protein ACK2T7_09445 [Anaerolineales bacterium]